MDWHTLGGGKMKLNYILLASEMDVLNELEGTACYACLLLAWALADIFLALWQKGLLTLFVPILGNFWCSVVTSIFVVLT